MVYQLAASHKYLSMTSFLPIVNESYVKQLCKLQSQYQSAIIFKKYLNQMSFPILQQYEIAFPDSAALLQSFPNLYTKRLWNQLTIASLQFIYHPQVKGKITFAFYSDFVKRFQKNIDQINLLKIIRESLASLSNQDVIQFLSAFEKETASEEAKIIVAAFKGYYSIGSSLETASQQLSKVKAYIDTHKDVDSFIYSSYYRLAFTFYASKRKYKQFYNSALQYLAYTQTQQLEEKQKLNLLFEMAIAVLVSDQIYNFSELLEQPLLISLKSSPYAWMYELLEIFNRGDIQKFKQLNIQHEELVRNQSKLQQKIRLMAFLELAFNLPKNDRVISFETLSKTCDISIDQVEFMTMKSMALELIKGSINQIRQEVTVTWVAPKVLEMNRISTMLGKFQQWEDGIKKVEDMVKAIRV